MDVTKQHTSTSQNASSISEEGYGGVDTEQCQQYPDNGFAHPSEPVQSVNNRASGSRNASRERQGETDDDGDQVQDSSVDSTEIPPLPPPPPSPPPPPDPETALINYVVNAIRDGSKYLIQQQYAISKAFSAERWAEPDWNRFSAVELYDIHGESAEKTLLYSRKSALTQCLLAVAITWPTGRLRGWNNEDKSKKRLRQFRARAGTFMIELVNALAAALSAQGDKAEIAYFICFTLMGE